MMKNVCALAAAALSLAAAAALPPKGGFKIVSYNVRHCEGMDGKLDVARIAAVLNREGPRFAALQELDCRTKRSNGIDEPAELGRLTGMVPTFAKTIDYDGGEYGVMILSREKPVSVEKLPLPGKEPRVLLLAEFSDCFVGSTHLSVAAEKERIDSVALIEKAVKGRSKPVFVAGDWNSLCNSSVLKGLSKSLKVLSPTRCRTFHGKPHEGPSGLVDDFCIDYIAVDSASASRYDVVDRAVIEDRVSSDHAPIYVTLAPKGEYSPFSPVSYRATGETSFEVEVWGRTYRYENSVFPVSVKTAGREMFAAPMALHARFGEAEGEFRQWQYTLVGSGPDKVTVVASAHCSNVMVNAAMTFEPDGLARTELKIVPYGYYSLEKIRDYEPDLSALWFDISLAPESSTLFHYWPYSENSCVVTADVNSGETRDRDMPFRAYVWCGWEDGGFSVTCESAEAFEVDDEKRYISVAKGKDATRIRYHLLDHKPAAWSGRRDRWGDALMPLCWDFGLQATPVKARPQGDPDVYRRIHIYDVPGARVLETDLPGRLGRAGVRYVVLHASYSRAEGYGLIGDGAKFKEMVDRFHANGVKVLVYYGYEYPTILPGWSAKSKDYLIRHPGGKYVGGWQAPGHRAYQSCYMSGWADEVERNVFAMIDQYGLDGIYTDGMYIPWECANERHGCGWRDAQGRLRPTFPIYAVRRLARRLYAGVHARGGTIDAHQSACMVTPLLAYADSCFDGENVQDALAKNPEHLPTDAFRCEYSGYAFGLPMTFISYTNDKLTIQMIAAITLVHNVHPVPRELSDLDFVSGVWKIYEERELDSAKFVPYWRENVSETKGVWCSRYLGGGMDTAVVSNLTSSRKRATLNVGAGYVRARDLLGGEAHDVRDGRLVFDVERFRPYIFALEK